MRPFTEPSLQQTAWPICNLFSRCNIGGNCWTFSPDLTKMYSQRERVSNPPLGLLASRRDRLPPSWSLFSFCGTHYHRRMNAAVFDLDRTLLPGASGPVISEALHEVGLMGGPIPPRPAVCVQVVRHDRREPGIHDARQAGAPRRQGLVPSRSARGRGDSGSQTARTGPALGQGSPRTSPSRRRHACPCDDHPLRRSAAICRGAGLRPPGGYPVPRRRWCLRRGSGWPLRLGSRQAQSCSRTGRSRRVRFVRGSGVFRQLLRCATQWQ